MANVKGTKITSKLAFLDEEYGATARARVLAALSDEDRTVIASVIEAGWYPQDVYERLLKAVCSELSAGDPLIYTRIGRHTAEHQFTGSYRVFRTPELAKTLRNLGPMHSRLNDPSEMQVELDEAGGRCAIVVHKPASTSVICAISRAFYERTVELCGAHEVRIVEPQCTSRGDSACRFELTWRPRAAASAAPTLDATPRVQRTRV